MAGASAILQSARQRFPFDNWHSPLLALIVAPLGVCCKAGVRVPFGMVQAPRLRTGEGNKSGSSGVLCEVHEVDKNAFNVT